MREKGYFELIEAARLLKERQPQVRFLAIGDALASDYDDSKQQMQDVVKAGGIEDRFVFAGLRDDVAKLLAASDIFSLPSYREGMPVSILEAMAMGLPCVVTDIRGSREEVVDGECGYVVPVRDAEILAERIGGLAEGAELRKKLGTFSRERVLNHFQSEQYFGRQWEIYKQFLRS